MNKLLKVAMSTLLVGAVSLHTATTMASVINEIEANNTAATAQNVDGLFSLGFNADIGDASGANTSTDLAHVSILGTGDGSYDFYSFTTLGGLTILDIDYGSSAGVSFDAELGIWDSLGNLLANNDDTSTVAGAGGSSNGLDSFIQLSSLAAGSYTVGVCQWGCSFSNNNTITGSGISGDYTLQISTANEVNAVPEPSVIALMALGLIGFGAFGRKKLS